jgi:Uncharacterized protein conserved in bacteria
MNINKFTKLKDGQYKIILEDLTNIVIHEDLILKYDLLLTKKLDEETKEKILKENLNYIAYSIALKYISTRMRSIKEVIDYLDNKGVDKKIIESCINILTSNGYLNDEQFAKSFINDKINLSNDGPYKISKELSGKGVLESIIQENIINFFDDIQIEKCTKVVNKLTKTNRTKSLSMLKKKIISYLINLGYNMEIINIATKNLNAENNDEIMKKEYQKIHSRLSKKYSGKELEYKIKQKMYALGFNNIE